MNTQHEFHPIANIFPMMSPEEFAALRDDIQQNGLLEPVWLHPDGRIVDGRNRYKACVELGIEPLYRTWSGEGSITAFVVSLNLHRRHLSTEQRATVAVKMLPMLEAEAKERQAHGMTAPGKTLVKKTSQAFDKSRQQAAAATGTNQVYVSDAKRIHETAPDVFDMMASGSVNMPAAKQLADLPENERKEIFAQHTNESGKIKGPDVQRYIEAKRPHVANNSGNNEWYTPREYIAAAYAVLGEIDLDPASSEAANTVVRAKRIFTADEDGLSQKWAGRVWMNPPYASNLIGQFTKKLSEDYADGVIEEAIVLVNNATETGWFQSMLEHCAAVCFPRSRVKFWKPDGETGAPLQGQAILYFGCNAKLFSSSFADIGKTLYV